MREMVKKEKGIEGKTWAMLVFIRKPRENVTGGTMGSFGTTEWE
jgi:hypothetical protein